MTATTPTNDQERNTHSSGAKIFALSAIGKSIQQMLLDKTEGQAFWIRAEISKVTRASSGHFYLDLVEEVSGRQEAKMRASIWKGNAATIRRTLGNEFDAVLKNGREIVFSARITYHPVFGLSLDIQDIDLSSMLGELERRKQLTLSTLKAEGAVGPNRRLKLSLAPQRVLLIGSPGTAGFRDFISHIQENEHGYSIDLGILPVTVQGESAAGQIIHALKLADRIAEKTPIDAVALLRGGGSPLDLDVFNDLNLCRQIAASSRPILTGIGHEIDLTLADVVAHRAYKTPTDVADGIIDSIGNFHQAVMDKVQGIAHLAEQSIRADREAVLHWHNLISERPVSKVQLLRGALSKTGFQLAQITRQQLAHEQLSLAHNRSALGPIAIARIAQVERPQLSNWHSALEQHTRKALLLQNERIAGLQRTLGLLAPERTLARGFSITRTVNNGKALTNTEGLQAGERLSSTLSSGVIESEIIHVKPNHHE